MDAMVPSPGIEQPRRRPSTVDESSSGREPTHPSAVPSDAKLTPQTSPSTRHDQEPLPTRSPNSSPTHPHQYRGLAAQRSSPTRAWIKCFARWLVTVIFIVAVYAVLIGYEAYDVISRTQKRQFSALITGFLIALALITLNHLTSIVVDLRWWILSRRPRSRRKV